jgi:hypothetical protein
MVACGDATASNLPTVDDVLVHRAQWVARGVTNYSYDYTESGFFICCTQGQAITLAVRNDTVVSAVFAATGQPVPGAPTRFPTINGLFAGAVRAAQARSLSRITYDPLLDYPVRIDFAGPPDASGSEFAVHLQRLP